MASSVRVTLFLLTIGLFLLAAPIAFADNGGFTPVAPESKNAEAIRDSYVFLSIFALAIFLLVQGLLLWFVLRFRRQRRGRFEDGAQIHGSTRLELAWTVAPVLVLVAIAAFVFAKLPAITDVPEAEAGQQLEIKVSGRQFFWQYEYPNGVIAIDRMRAPAGVPVSLEITAPDGDVIHSWWIPALAGKVDAIPGTVTESWFEVDDPGVYTGQCAELCGLAHAQMLASVEILSVDDFAAWLDERRANQSGDASALGEEVWEGACAKCHGLAGEGGTGPRLAGSAVLTDAEALESIVRTGRGDMPAIGADWSEEQMRALTTYLEENPPRGQ